MRRTEVSCNWCGTTFEYDGTEDDFWERYFAEDWFLLSVSIHDTEDMHYCSNSCLVAEHGEED
jgi:hypothetical protein